MRAAPQANMKIVANRAMAPASSSAPPTSVLLIDPPASGPWNMAVDEALLEAAASEGQCTLRFYQWDEPTLSLGYFQTYADRSRHEASRHAAIVRRNTGGGAILHDHELTYSLAVPDSHPLAADRLGMYRAVHSTLIATLAEWDIAAHMFAQAESTPDGRIGCGESDATHDRQSFLCFLRRSPGDVLVGHTKVTGSAQRRCRGAVLQHGSVLLAQSEAAPELDGLAELTNRVISPLQLVDAWVKRLVELTSFSLQPGQLTELQRCRATALTTEQYACPVWTQHRGRG